MFKRLKLFIINLLVITILGLLPFANALNFNVVMSGNICPSNIVDKIFQLVKPDTKIKETEVVERFKVYVSGRPIGFSIDGDGVVVVSVGEIKTPSGFVDSPCEVAGVKPGDIIKKVNGVEITSGERLIDVVNSKPGEVCSIELDRKGEIMYIEVRPMFDEFALSYRLGVWVRDNSVGVGTVTYVTQDNCYSALGHPVTDADTSTILPVGEGRAFKCSIVGVKRGEKGEPGELKGLFLKTSNEVGDIVSNTTTGIKGQLVSEDVSEMFKDLELTEIALRKEVRVGDAYIYTTIDGNTPKLYDIEIVKTNHVNSYGNKCMVIRITDKELLSKTGGIVQGMSGSPILQNGKLVGCVTHVFINDPSKGFADFIDLEK